MFLAAYFLLQKNKITHDSYLYLGLNFGGAVLLLASLWWDFNLAAFLLEAAWGVISAYGLAVQFRKTKRKRHTAPL